MDNFRYADIHCHPNLKTFGHSFDKRKNKKSDMWYQKLPALISNKIHQLTGVTKFSQADFTTLSAGNAKIIFLSLYPFEKGFFMGSRIPSKLAAMLSDWGIEIGYSRIRYLQKHTDYFNDLTNEYNFVLNSIRSKVINETSFNWQLAADWNDVENILKQDNTIAVIITIEGAHVFNSGLAEYGKDTDESEILANIIKVKKWQYPPVFIGLAHNFNNDLCGHARSLQRIGKMVDQEKNLGVGITDTGLHVIHAMLDDTNGRSIYIDLKHMSLLARQEYYQLLRSKYSNRKIPLIVSHGALTGISYNGESINSGCADIFNTNDINFYDEEIIAIAKSGGLFALQMDVGINADPKKIKKWLPINEKPVKRSARIIWNQLQHIAMVLDRNGLFAWNITAIGSDFDGSINPFPGILTATSFRSLAAELIGEAENFLSLNILIMPENKQILPQDIVERFVYINTEHFLKHHF